MSSAEPEKIFVVYLHFFGSTSKISRFGERFCDVQYSLASFLFAVILSAVPPFPAICKSGGACPRTLWSRRHWLSALVPRDLKCFSRLWTLLGRLLLADGTAIAKAR